MKNYLIDEAGFDYVHLITEEKVTIDRLQNVMVDGMPGLVKSNDRFVFYWSGHGTTRESNNKNLGYLPLKDSTNGQFSTMLRMKALADWDDALEAKQTLYLLDACFSGLAGFATKSSRRQTIKQIARPSRQILTAGLPNEETIAIASLGGSLFTTALIDGLKGEADASFGSYEKDGIVSAKELELYTKLRVNEEIRIRGWNRTITPSLLSLPGGRGDFFFIANESTIQGQEDLVQRQQGEELIRKAAGALAEQKRKKTEVMRTEAARKQEALQVEAARKKVERNRAEAARKQAEVKKQASAVAIKRKQLAATRERRVAAAKWGAKIQRHVRRYWKPPPDTAGQIAKVRLEVSSAGYIKGFQFVQCNMQAFCSSIEDAFQKAEPLPAPSRFDLDRRLLITLN